MAQRFIIAIDSAGTTREMRNAITAFLEQKGWQTWHWMEDIWLVVNSGEVVALQDVREQVRAAVAPASPNIMILSPEGSINYAGIVPQNSIQWLTENWN